MDSIHTVASEEAKIKPGRTLVNIQGGTQGIIDQGEPQKQ